MRFANVQENWGYLSSDFNKMCYGTLLKSVSFYEYILCTFLKNVLLMKLDIKIIFYTRHNMKNFKQRLGDRKLKLFNLKRFKKLLYDFVKRKLTHTDKHVEQNEIGPIVKELFV